MVPLPLPTTVTAEGEEITSAIPEMGCSYLRAYSLLIFHIHAKACQKDD